MFSLSEEVPPSSDPDAGGDDDRLTEEDVLRLRVHGRISAITEWWTISDPRVGKVLADPCNKTSTV